jgi:hypothetical protein
MAVFDIERVGDREDDLVLEYDLALPGDNSIVAALRTNSSYLKMVRYRLQTDGGISLSGQDQTLQAANVAITAPAANRSVTVCSANMKMLVSQWGELSHAYDVEGADIASSSIASFRTRFSLIPPGEGPKLPPGGLQQFPTGYLTVTAHSNIVHQFRVTAWMAGDSELFEIASATSPARSTLSSIVAFDSTTENGSLETATVITASSGPGYKLRLAMWRIRVVPHETPTVELVGELQTEQGIKEVSSAKFTRADGDYLATAIITREDTLSVLTWKVESNGTFTAWKSATGGVASGIDCASLMGNYIAVGCKDSSNKLKIIYWRFPHSERDGQDVTRAGAAAAGVIAGRVKIVHKGVTQTVPGETIAACRTEAGKLKLIRFRLSISTLSL